MDDFIIYALLAGTAVVLMTGPLGAFIVWRRMVYFGDTLSHSALLGVAIGFLFHLNLNFAIIIVCLFVAMVMLPARKWRKIGNNTLLGILSHTALSLGLIALTFIEGVRIDLMAYLFGDILAVTAQDLWLIWTVSGISLGVLFFIWHSLLSLTVNEELAQVEGINTRLISAVYMILIALVVAVAMKIVGILLITALLIIPPATARQFAKTPEQMAIFAIVIGLIALSGGMYASFQWDTPAGPSIVITAAILFFFSLLNSRS